MAEPLERRPRGGKGCFASQLPDLTRNLFSVCSTDPDGLFIICSLVYIRRSLGLSVPFWLQDPGACNCCWSRLRMGQYLENSAGAHLGSSRQCNILAYMQPAKAAMLILCSLERLFFWPFFLFISGSKFIKCLTTQGALELHHLHCHTAGRSPPAPDQFKTKKTSRKELEAELDEKHVIKKNKS